MKWLPKAHRESQSEFYGKRGISWHGSAVFVNNVVIPDLGTTTGKQLQGHTTLFFDDVISNDDKQDVKTVCCILDAILCDLRKQFSGLKQLTIQSDNASCYSSALFFSLAAVLARSVLLCVPVSHPFSLISLLPLPVPSPTVLQPLVRSNHAFELLSIVHNESGDGKTILDAHFGVMSRAVSQRIDAGADAKDPISLFNALSGTEARNTHVRLLEIPSDTTRGSLVELAKSKDLKVTGSSVVREVTYFTDPDGRKKVRLLRHSLKTGVLDTTPPFMDIDIPKLVDRFDLNARGCEARCICRVVLGEHEGDGEGKKNFLVQCSNGTMCHGWIHPSCFGLDNDAPEFAADEYECEWCRTGVMPTGDKVRVSPVSWAFVSLLSP